MRSLAHVIMRGPASAAIIVALACLMPMASFVGAAAIALVILRKGLNAALPLILVGTACGLMWFKSAGDISILLTLASSIASALCLRSTQSWQQSLLVIVAASILSYFVLLQYAPEYLQQIVSLFKQVQEQITSQSQNANQQLIEMLNIKVTDAASFTALSVGYMSTLSLVIARWWQAALYNPGGFAEEFQAVRIHPAVSIALVSASVLAISQEYFIWAFVLTLPLLIAGLALVHAYVNWKQIGQHWLIIFYALLLLGNGLKMGLVILAVIDSQVDFRKRWQSLSSQ